MKAILKTYRQSTRKVRLLADLIRGKKVLDAKNILMFADKRAAPIFGKLLDSAIANAKQNFSIEATELFVKEATVNQGVTLKRSMPRARGSAFPINKRTSHIAIVLDVKQSKSETLNPKSEKKIEATKIKKAKVVKAKK
jgi:large subunit ribosomal protein L22